MADPEPPPAETPRRPRRFQFGLGTMLLAAVPVSILSAAWAGMTGFGAGSSRFPPAFFVLLAAAAPVGLVILFSVGRALLRLAAERRR